LYVGALLLCGGFAVGTARAADEEFQAGVEPLTRGPIHEAFAQPLGVDGEERFVVTQKPPDPIEEIPPDEKPEGENVVWISGYWQWDDELSDFIWVSGCWRAVPPGTAWMPGYWLATEQGYEWVSGFWKQADTRKIVYLPEPPETLELGPTTYAVADDRVWVPGCWVWQSGFLWQSGRYAWRPGFWLAARLDWMWVPAHYARTPYGYVFVDGYWDYDLERRGTVFLPVHYSRETRLRVGFYYSPYLVFDLRFLTLNLFCSPARRHYYYGDYYGARYRSAGYRPWFEPSRRSRCYEPVFTRERWRHRNDRDWSRRQASDYEYRRNHDDARPSRTYRHMQERHRSDRSDGHSRGRDERVARPLSEVARDTDGPVRYERVSPRRRDEDTERSRRLGDYRQERSRWETPDHSERRSDNDRDDSRRGDERFERNENRRGDGRFDRDDDDNRPIVPPVRVPSDRTTVPVPVERDWSNGRERVVVPPVRVRVEDPERDSSGNRETPGWSSGRSNGREGGRDTDHLVRPPVEVPTVDPARDSSERSNSRPRPTEHNDGRNRDRDSGRVDQPVVTPTPPTRPAISIPRERPTGESQTGTEYRRVERRSYEPVATPKPQTGSESEYRRVERRSYEPVATPKPQTGSETEYRRVERRSYQPVEPPKPQTVRPPSSPIVIERRSRTEASPPSAPRPPRVDSSRYSTRSREGSTDGDAQDSRRSWEERRNR
jgi:hypothetical protein